MNQHRIDALMSELSDLEHALDACDDEGKRTRLRAMVASRKSQIESLRQHDRGAE